MSRKITKDLKKAKLTRKSKDPPPPIQSQTIISMFTKQKTKVVCPICSKSVFESDINKHLDNNCQSFNNNKVIDLTQDETEHAFQSTSKYFTTKTNETPQKNVEKNLTPSKKLTQIKRKLSESEEVNTKRLKTPEKTLNKNNVEKTPEKSKTPTKTPEKTNSPIKINSPSKNINRPYYLENFLLILRAVTSHPDDRQLFNQEDKNIIEKFNILTLDAQKFYVRMYQRKLKWHQTSKIEYPDLNESVDSIVDELVNHGFLNDGNNLNDLPCVLNLMQLNDMKLLTKNLNLNQISSKSLMIDKIMKQCKQQKTLFTKSMDQVIMKQAKSILGKCFQLDQNIRSVFFRVLMLFSLSSYVPNDKQKQQQELLTIHMVNTRQLVFPDYSVLRSSKIFRSRDDLIQYANMYEKELEISTAMEDGKWEKAFDSYSVCPELFSTYVTQNTNLYNYSLTLPTFLRQYSVGATLTRCLSKGVEILERSKKYEDAVEILEKILNQTDFHVGHRGRWTERLALNLEQHLKQPEKALNVVIKGLNDPHIRGGHKLGLHQRAMRICKSSKKNKLKKMMEEIPDFDIREIPKIQIEGRVLQQSNSGFKSTFITQDSYSQNDVIMCSVEQLAINHYRDIGFDEGVHGESSVFTSIYCLLFWDIIYQSGIPDVFRSPHQNMPLDLNSEYFYTQRKIDIDQMIDWIKNSNTEAIQDRLAVNWTAHQGQISLVDWNLFSSIIHLEGLIECIDSTVLAKICERLAKDFRFTRSGFPDLVVWSPANKWFKVVEVKGPNDRLSTKQILWLDFLLGIGVDAEVCHVAAAGAKKLKKKSVTE